MPASLSEKKEIEILKDKAVEYYRKVPIKSLTAAKVGRSYDAINKWENDDANFARRLQEAKADFVSKQLESRKMTPQFALERIFREQFGNTLDLTTKGEKIIVPILGGNSYVPGDDSDPEDTQTTQTN